MKYSCEVIIDLHIDRVVELFDNPDNLKHWQPGLLSFERISGNPGQPGAKSRLKFKMGNRDIEMIETVTVRNLPHEFSGTYDAKGVFNIVKNYFTPMSATQTRFVSEQEFKFSGFMKAVGFMLPDVFRKTSQQYLTHFKAFAEKEARKATG
ncbi:MAG: SRPBCC family protein [Proteobacteria bacterium]|nr:MAG: SRPBCC family protein [Pseudomonadota bacterium]